MWSIKQKSGKTDQFLLLTKIHSMKLWTAVNDVTKLALEHFQSKKNSSDLWEKSP